jgi:hypothetical protein
MVHGHVLVALPQNTFLPSKSPMMLNIHIYNITKRVYRDHFIVNVVEN